MMNNLCTYNQSIICLSMPSCKWRLRFVCLFWDKSMKPSSSPWTPQRTTALLPRPTPGRRRRDRISGEGKAGEGEGGVSSLTTINSHVGCSCLSFWFIQAVLGVNVPNVRKNHGCRVWGRLRLCINRKEHWKAHPGWGIVADIIVINVLHERAPNGRCLSVFLGVVVWLILMFFRLGEVTCICCILPPRPLQFFLHPTKVLRELEKRMDYLLETESKLTEYARNSVFDHVLHESVTLPAVIDWLHEHTWISFRVGFYKCLICRHTEFLALCIAGVPLLSHLWLPLGQAARAREYGCIKPTDQVA